MEGPGRTRAAEILAALILEDTGVEKRHVLREQESVADLMPTLAYLVAYGWISGRDGWRYLYVWSETREALREPAPDW